MKTNLEDVDLLHIYNAREAAIELNLSHETLRAYAVKYGLGEKKGHEWRFSKAEIEKEIINWGASRYPIVSIIRKPRETVRAEKVLEAETLPEKLEAMAELRGEEVSGSILEKATSLESGEQQPWIMDKKLVKHSDDRMASIHPLIRKMLDK